MNVKEGDDNGKVLNRKDSLIAIITRNMNFTDENLWLKQLKQNLGNQSLNLDKPYDTEGNTALMLAIINNSNSGICEFIMQQGVDLTAQNNRKQTALTLSIEYLKKKNKKTGNYREDLIQKIIDNLPDKEKNLNIQDENGNTALMLSLMYMNDNYTLVKSLLDSGANVNLQNNNGQTALHLAAANENRAQCLDLLLEDQNADLSIQDIDGDTPLMYRVKPLGTKMFSSNLEYELPRSSGVFLDKMLQKIQTTNPKIFNIQNNEGKTALLIAVQNYAIMSKLIKVYHVDTSLKDKTGKSVLDYLMDNEIKEKIYKAFNGGKDDTVVDIINFISGSPAAADGTYFSNKKKSKRKKGKGKSKNKSKANKMFHKKRRSPK